jgi:hypothetical protein
MRQAACRRVVLRRLSQLNECAQAIKLVGKEFESVRTPGSSVSLSQSGQRAWPSDLIVLALSGVAASCLSRWAWRLSPAGLPFKAAEALPAPPVTMYAA